jgi:hypothetical protein
MKTLKAGYTWLLCGTIGFLALTVWTARGADPTAFELIKEGNKFVGTQSKDKVITIHSDKSVLGVTPSIWYVAYYDPDVTSKLVQVKFGAGRQMGIKRGWRPFGRSGTMDRVMDLTKLKVDSDKAIKIATSEPLIAKLTIKATQLWLENDGLRPTWKVRLWAAKLNQPDATANLGDIFISAETGEVVKSELNINKAG